MCRSNPFKCPSGSQGGKPSLSIGSGQDSYIVLVIYLYSPGNLPMNSQGLVSGLTSPFCHAISGVFIEDESTPCCRGATSKGPVALIELWLSLISLLGMFVFCRCWWIGWCKIVFHPLLWWWVPSPNSPKFLEWGEAENTAIVRFHFVCSPGLCTRHVPSTQQGLWSGSASALSTAANVVGGAPKTMGRSGGVGPLGETSGVLRCCDGHIGHLKAPNIHRLHRFRLQCWHTGRPLRPVSWSYARIWCPLPPRHGWQFCNRHPKFSSWEHHGLNISLSNPIETLVKIPYNHQLVIDH